MTRKLSMESVETLFDLHGLGRSTLVIAQAIGCARSTVVRYLNEAGIILGNRGSKKQITEEYVSLALQMRAQGLFWTDIGEKIGFSHRSLQREAKAYQAATGSMNA